MFSVDPEECPQHIADLQDIEGADWGYRIFSVSIKSESIETEIFYQHRNFSFIKKNLMI